MKKRDLKADLEILTGDWGAHESDWFRDNGVAIATHAIERALRAEKALDGLADAVMKLPFCYRYFAEHEAAWRNLNGAVAKAKEVLGNDRQGDYRTP